MNKVERPEPTNFQSLPNGQEIRNVMRAMREIMWGRKEIIGPLILETHALIKAGPNNYSQENKLNIAFLGSGHGGDAAAIMRSFSEKGSPINPEAVRPMVLDNNIESVVLARGLNEQENVRVDYVVADARSPALKPNITIMANLIHHLFDKEAAETIKASAQLSQLGCIVFEPAKSQIAEFVVPRLAAMSRKNPDLSPEAVNEVVRQSRESYIYAHDKKSFDGLASEVIKETDLTAQVKFQFPWFLTMVVSNNPQVVSSFRSSK